MYHCKLKIHIFSHSFLLEEVLKKVPAKERFEHEFETFSSISLKKLGESDIAIIDLPLCYLPSELRAACKKEGRLVYCLKREEHESDLDAICQYFDDVWESPFNEVLTAFYFERLLAFIKSQKDLWLTENYLESGINSIPDLVWYKDIRGAHLKVNDAFCQAVGKTKKEVEGRGHYYIWDLKKEEYEKGEYVCLETEEIVLRERKTCLFDEKVKSKHGLRQFKTYKSPIFGDDGEPIGTVGVAHDVTDLENMGTEMEIILRSMPFSILVVDSEGLIINANERFEDYFKVKRDEIINHNYQEWRTKTLVDSVLSEDGKTKEVTICNDGKESLLEIREEPIYDIFYNLVGRIYIYRDVTAERALEEQILYNSNTDFLTGLYNRRYFYEYVNQYRNNQPVSLIYLDLDHFKGINDSFGHQTGDEVLIATAELLKICFPEAFLTRLGGDEFLIMILGKCDLRQLSQRVEDLLNEIDNKFLQAEKTNLPTASVGIAQTDDPHLSIDQLMRQSDLALYQAKESGRNQYQIYTPEMMEK
ncbi:sensor domain-containing diguanylate cyclase [Beduini massiliensis]|uniref:sensor domain-containing diguanylate cyclase n=1 Tax=Beduini massiliensis TaxID=1585974 RepID=UPI00059A989D|nr:sensor domain-containing diguanylate cyclase [Beduini massiliensis]